MCCVWSSAFRLCFKNSSKGIQILQSGRLLAGDGDLILHPLQQAFLASPEQSTQRCVSGTCYEWHCSAVCLIDLFPSAMEMEGLRPLSPGGALQCAALGFGTGRQGGSSARMHRVMSNVAQCAWLQDGCFRAAFMNGDVLTLNCVV